MYQFFTRTSTITTDFFLLKEEKKKFVRQSFTLIFFIFFSGEKKSFLTGFGFDLLLYSQEFFRRRRRKKKRNENGFSCNVRSFYYLEQASLLFSLVLCFRLHGSHLILSSWTIQLILIQGKNMQVPHSQRLLFIQNSDKAGLLRYSSIHIFSCWNDHSEEKNILFSFERHVMCFVYSHFLSVDFVPQ